MSSSVSIRFLRRSRRQSATFLARPAGRKTDGTAEHGYLHCGPNGAGHFVKMVHNGIEYGVMAAYAEGLGILRSANVGNQTHGAADAETTPLRDPELYRYELNLRDITEVWRRGSVIASWLLDLTANSLVQDPNLGSSPAASRTQAKGVGRSKRRLMKRYRCRFSPARSTNDSVRAAKPTLRTRCFPQCGLNSAGTWKNPTLSPRPNLRPNPNKLKNLWQPSALRSPGGRSPESEPARPMGFYFDCNNFSKCQHPASRKTSPPHPRPADFRCDLCRCCACLRVGLLRCRPWRLQRLCSSQVVPRPAKPRSETPQGPVSLSPHLRQRRFPENSGRLRARRGSLRHCDAELPTRSLEAILPREAAAPSFRHREASRCHSSGPATGTIPL